MNWLKENWFKVGILLSVFLFIWPFYYYYILYLPDQHEKKTQQETALQLSEESRASLKRKTTGGSPFWWRRPITSTTGLVSARVLVLITKAKIARCPDALQTVSNSGAKSQKMNATKNTPYDETLIVRRPMRRSARS